MAIYNTCSSAKTCSVQCGRCARVQLQLGVPLVEYVRRATLTWHHAA
jgi:hypothetical protein